VTILVTGGSGVIGRSLVAALLRDGLSVRVLTRRPEQMRARLSGEERVKGDLGDGSGLDDACRGAAMIYHLASHNPPASTPSPETGPEHWRITAEGTGRLLRAARAAGVRRIVFVSSVRAFPDPGENKPCYPYGIAKLEAERLVRESGIPFTILRLPVVYGSATAGNIIRMVAAIDRGRFPPLPRLENRRAMIHRDDVVRALRLIAERPESLGKSYILGDGEPYSSRRIQDAIRDALGLPPLKWAIPLAVLRAVAWMGDLAGRLRGVRPQFDSVILAKLTDSLWFDTSEIERELGFRPEQTLERALPEIIKAYRANHPRDAR